MTIGPPLVNTESESNKEMGKSNCFMRLVHKHIEYSSQGRKLLPNVSQPPSKEHDLFSAQSS